MQASPNASCLLAQLAQFLVTGPSQQMPDIAPVRWFVFPPERLVRPGAHEDDCTFLASQWRPFLGTGQLTKLDWGLADLDDVVRLRMSPRPPLDSCAFRDSAGLFSQNGWKFNATEELLRVLVADMQRLMPDGGVAFVLAAGWNSRHSKRAPCLAGQDRSVVGMLSSHVTLAALNNRLRGHHRAQAFTLGVGVPR